MEFRMVLNERFSMEFENYQLRKRPPIREEKKKDPKKRKIKLGNQQSTVNNQHYSRTFVDDDDEYLTQDTGCDFMTVEMAEGNTGLLGRPQRDIPLSFSKKILDEDNDSPFMMMEFSRRREGHDSSKEMAKGKSEQHGLQQPFFSSQIVEDNDDDECHNMIMEFPIRRSEGYAWGLEKVVEKTEQPCPPQRVVLLSLP